MKIVFYGAGAIGSTLAGWLYEHNENVFLLARGKNAEAIESKGLTLYELDKQNSKNIPIKVIRDLNELDKIDIVAIVVKNYDLEEVAKDIFEKLGDMPIIVGLQNGFENQKIFPKYFSKIIYGVIVCSAWYDEPGVFGNRGKGNIILGTLNNENMELVEKVKEVFSKGFSVKITKRFNDAAHSKLLFNLGNSIFTIISEENLDADIKYKTGKIFIYSFLEGLKVLKAAGIREHKMKGLPPWRSIEIAAQLDQKALLEAFEESMKFSWLNSMAQDMVIVKRKKSEIDSLTGYFIELAKKYNIDVPINRTLYELCNEAFRKENFTPLHVDEVLNEINKNLGEKYLLL